MYRIFTNANSFDCANVDELRKTQEYYQLWLDIPLKKFKEIEKGEIDLLSKRILGRLLVFLIINANEDFTPIELYKQVWCLKPSGLNEESTIRTNISRLRNLVEPSSQHWKYIKKTETSFLSNKGAYFFDNSSNYCLIMKKEIVMQFM